jgi:RNA polymerase sigma-70 factor (ECF subfamily)
MVDAEVIQLVLAGDTALFELLVRRYNQRLYRVSRAIVKDENEAEDVMQQAYVNAYVHLAQFAGRCTFATWLTKIAVHEALSRVRRPQRVQQSLSRGDSEDADIGALPSITPDPEHEAFASELRKLLEAVIDDLSDGYRSVFMMREVEGLTTLEVAQCLDITEDTVKTRLHRAKLLLRQAIAERVGYRTAEAFQFHLSRCDRVVSNVLAKIDALACQSVN